MRSKMGKKEREFSDSERDMQSAQREAESAQRESEEMKAVERQLAQQSGLGGVATTPEVGVTTTRARCTSSNETNSAPCEGNSRKRSTR